MKVVEKVNDTWWWVELNGEFGYAPVNHLSPGHTEVDFWQDEEYFSSYEAMVCC